ncbi:energy-coupling factor transporter transmembrane component T [Miniphocaeibacter massiliensis]|uniref:energy-coupling factor transporter transmembrane component T n=1 Tax=Miniphocaeibacter massiliensis TaxID=2041841 RepID=UPI000C1C5088|nr:energy-coupling factor transporter transmembrane component T [Miniphocaeibacter massiliensis]
MNTLRAKKPLYPLLCILSSLVVFIFGMLIAKTKFLLIFLIALMVVYIIFSYGEVTFKLLCIFIPLSIVPATLSIPVGGVENSIQIYFRFICFIMAAIPSMGLPPINLVRNLNELKVSRVLSIAILITIRFIPILALEIKQTWNAMKSRGVKVSIFNPQVMYRALLLPIIIRIISISDLLSLSLETRAFVIDDKEATKYKVVKFTIRDAIYTIILMFLVCIIGYLFLRGD